MAYPHFSVCISVYKNDCPEWFYTAVKSITDQSVTPSEVVIVVDGPIGDELDAVVKHYENQADRFKIIRLPVNRGHAIARQTGLNAASNDLVAIMDADDIAEPNRFELQLKAFDEHPQVSVVGGQINEFINNPDNIVGSRIVPLDDKDIKIYLKSRCPMNLVTVMFRKSDIEAVGGYLDWYCEEDYYLWIRLALKGYKFYNIQQNLVNVRVGADMYRRRGGWRYFKSEARLQRYMLSHKLISCPRYVYNVLGRFVVQVAMPNWLRGFVFQKLFRN